MMRIAFEEFGCPTWPIDRAIYTVPIKLAINMKIPLVVYGENVSWEYGGPQENEHYSAIDIISNDVAKDIDWSVWYDAGFTNDQLKCLEYPDAMEIEDIELEPIYLSYFVPWDGRKNYEYAKSVGFKEMSWRRNGYIEDYDQVDSIGYLTNVILKYVKYGFGRTTDVVGYWIRSGYITKTEGQKLIDENDHLLDERILRDFLKFAEYKRGEFERIVEKHKGG
jgi:hypothetical protein